jgi:L,D-transpeptidase YcbB
MRCVRIPLFVALASIGMAALPSASLAQTGLAAATSSVTVELRDRAGGKLKRFYANRNYAPVWFASGTMSPAADSLLDLLTAADLDGLKSSSYKVAELREALDASRSGGPAAVVKAELKLSKTFTRYVSDMRRASKPQLTYVDPVLKPKKPNPESVMVSATLARSFTDYIKTMGWMSPLYRQQRTLLARARETGSTPATLDRIRINRDRARELPSAWTHHVVVDAASGRLYYYQAGRQEGTMRVVVGKAASPTPMLAGMLRYAILNPYWNVPVDLAQHSIAPKVIGGKSLASMRMEALSDWSATPQKLDAAVINWPAVAAGTTELRVRQLPGGDNAMGRIKFMFPNDMGIYLHDTPDKALMKEPDRHFSNGCIRLEDAGKLGKWLFGGQSPAKPKSPEKIAPLPLPVPVYLTYLTTAPTDKGVNVLDDVYGWDRR